MDLIGKNIKKIRPASERISYVDMESPKIKNMEERQYKTVTPSKTPVQIIRTPQPTPTRTPQLTPVRTPQHAQPTPTRTPQLTPTRTPQPTQPTPTRTSTTPQPTPTRTPQHTPPTPHSPAPVLLSAAENSTKLKGVVKSFIKDPAEAAEVISKVSNYLWLPRESWKLLGRDSKIKFIKKDKTFVDGRVVVRLDKSEEGKDFFLLKVGHFKNAKHYRVYLDEVAVLFKEDAAGPEIEIVNKSIINQKNKIDKLYDTVKLLARKMAAMEIELRKLKESR
nr:hypothetical protein K-LCC10_0120 [Kaumoebavirus]